MDKEYDERYHLHLGYYEDNCDYESVAFKRKTEDIWDIYFDFKQYGIKNSSTMGEKTLEEFGTRIFSINNKELNDDIGVKRFEQWLF
jgi:hypothetical protein